MMTRIIIKHPSPEDLAKYGILAHVEKEERDRIFAVPHGRFQPEIKRLTKEVDLVKFPRKKKSCITEVWYNPKFKKVAEVAPTEED